MNKSREVILLDNRNYIENGRQWNIPILKLSGIESIKLVIDNEEIVTSKYQITGNILTFSENRVISNYTVAHLTVEITPTNNKVTFWLPIILAIISFAGAILQPILHELKILYVPEKQLHIENSALSYDESHNTVLGKVDISPVGGKERDKNSYITRSDFDKWQIIVAVKELENNIPPEMQKYIYISGPYNLDFASQNFSVPTSQEFTAQIKKANKEIVTEIAIIKKGTKIDIPFIPNNIKDGDYRLISRSSYKINETLKFD